jgi:hypothetical protein
LGAFKGLLAVTTFSQLAENLYTATALFAFDNVYRPVFLFHNSPHHCPYAGTCLPLLFRNLIYSMIEFASWVIASKIRRKKSHLVTGGDHIITD